MTGLHDEPHAVPDVHRIERCVVDALLADGCVGPHGGLLLLRLYTATGGDELMDHAGLALAAGLRDHAAVTSASEQAAWLELFVEARTIADDDRVSAAIAHLVGTLQAAWTVDSVADAAAALDACLFAANHDEHRTLAAAAIDQLERVIGRSYRPGQGVGTHADQIQMSAALLTAYHLAHRLPYAMLAEELVAAAGSPGADADFTDACHAVRVLARLAALHDDAEYRQAAVIAPQSNYRRDAWAVLERHAAEAERLGAAGAIYGVALLELESSNLNTHD
jgi:hypothetical protein